MAERRFVYSFEQITSRVGCQKVALVQRSRCPCLSPPCDRFLLRPPTTEEANLPSRLKSSAKKKWGVPHYEATYNFYARVCGFFYMCVSWWERFVVSSSRDVL